MRGIDKVIAHWKSAKGERNKAVGFGGLEIHWGPWTLGEQDRVFGPFMESSGAIIMRAAVFARMLVVKAEDAEGKPLFSPAEEVELLAEADPKEVHRVGALMMADLNKANEAAAGAGGPKAT